MEKEAEQRQEEGGAERTEAAAKKNLERDRKDFPIQIPVLCRR